MSPTTPNGTTHDNMPNATYGFIGLGNMGSGMAFNVRLKMPKDSRLFVFDIDQSAVARFCEKTNSLGEVGIATSPKHIAEECVRLQPSQLQEAQEDTLSVTKQDIIITSLIAGKPIESVFNDPATGLFAAEPGARSRLFIDTSSIPVKTHLKLREQAERIGFGDFVDCPVSGGIPAAHEGKLVMMFGGTQQALDRVRPILLAMADPSSLYHCGPAGAGLATKIINNYTATASYIALCEGMNTGVRYGLDPKVLTDVLNAGSGMTWNSLHMNPVKGVQSTSSASRDFEGGASLEMAVESTEMAVELMDQVNAKYLIAPILKDVWIRAGHSKHCIGKEYRSVYRLFAEDSGKALGNVKVE